MSRAFYKSSNTIQPYLKTPLASSLKSSIPGALHREAHITPPNSQSTQSPSTHAKATAQASAHLKGTLTRPSIRMRHLNSRPNRAASLNFRTMATSASTDTPPQCRLSQPLPHGTWDSHTHVINPDFSAFPLVAAAEYKPHPHTIAEARSYFSGASGLGIADIRLVLTQVSIYGNDNSALLQGLRDLGCDKGRGVVEFDAGTVSMEQLREWNEAGVRGARINLVSRSRVIGEEELARELGAYVAAVEALGNWAVEMYVPLEYMGPLQRVLPRCKGWERVKFVVDHFGGMKIRDDVEAEYIKSVEEGKGDPYLIPGFRELVELVIGGEGRPDVFVKLSAQYRVLKDYPSERSLRLLDPVGRELVRRAPEKVIWASDWPHTRFEEVDSVPFVELCYEWCGSGAEGTRRRELFFRDNARRLWDIK